MKYTWKEAVDEIIRLYVSGGDSASISDELAGAIISGEGTIEHVETDSSVASAFIQLNMPRVEVPYKKKLICANFLALNFSEFGEQEIKEYSKGSTLSFVTTLMKSNGPFPGIEISEFEDEKEILIMLGTKESKIAEY